VTDKVLERIIRRDFGNQSNEVKQKLKRVTSESQISKNRIFAAILKLSNKDLNVIDSYVEMCNKDFRDVVSLAEYPRCSKVVLGEMEKKNKKRIYLYDWKEYSEWLNE